MPILFFILLCIASALYLVWTYNQLVAARHNLFGSAAHLESLRKREQDVVAEIGPSNAPPLEQLIELHNKAVLQYNTRIQQFPAIIIAHAAGFSPIAPFQ